VALYHPRWSIPCNVCETYQLTETREFKRDAGGELLERGGLPTPCHKCPKVPTWAREQYQDDWKRLRTLADEPTPENARFLDFYNRMKAVNWNHPAASDPLVLFLAGGIQGVEDQYARDMADRNHTAFVSVLGLLLKKSKGY
jgi:hypothetical protein